MWDYSKLAKDYDKRACYSQDAIDFLINRTKSKFVCDIGAGTGILTSQLLKNKKVIEVVPVEPNKQMSLIGEEKTKIKFIRAVAEDTGLDSKKFDLVTYGSSFNVCNQRDALEEAKRILKNGGYVSCLWNHRNLKNNLQKEIEKIIKKNVKDYKYGSRRKDQEPIFSKYNWDSEYHEFCFEFNFKKKDFIDGMKSHHTLKMQSGKKFKLILKEISDILPLDFNVPYKTVMWIAK